MAALALALCFGLSAGFIGRIKGSSMVLWFLIGFCLPFFGVAAALLYRNENAEDTRRCPECGKRVKLYEQICRKCGEDLYFPESEPESRQQTLFEA